MYRQKCFSFKPNEKLQSICRNLCSFVEKCTPPGLNNFGLCYSWPVDQNGSIIRETYSCQTSYNVPNHRKYVEVEEMLKDFDLVDPIVYNCFISANIQLGNLDEARRLFDEMPQ